jgi:hypothetical protein
MKTLLNSNEPAGLQQGIALQTLVGRLIASVIPATVRHKSFLVNDIPAGLNLTANTDRVVAVLSNLFNTVAAHAIDSCIRISAKVYGNIILVQLRDRNSINTYTIAHSLQEVQPIAESLGGYVGITSQRKNETTIVFSFPNLPAAA